MAAISRKAGWSALLAAAPLMAATSARAQDDAALAARVRTLEAQVRALTEELQAIKAAAPARASITTAAAAEPPAGEAPAPNAPKSMPAAVLAAAAPPPGGGSATTPTSSGSGSAPGAPSTAAQASAGEPKAKAKGPYTTYEGGTPTTAAVAAIQAGRPVIESADGEFTVNLLGVMHLDAADYRQATPGPLGMDFRRGAAAADTARARDLGSGSDFRRARLGLGGRAFGSFEYSFLYEFGGSGLEDAGHVQELWVQYSGLKPFHLRAGAFPPFEGLEDAGSTNGMLFLERPASSDVARGLAGGDFREALQLVANTPRWFVSSSLTGRLVGVVNASGSGTAQPFDSQLGFVGRGAVLPVKRGDDLVHLGVHGSYVARPADAAGPDAAAGVARYAIDLRERPELRVDGTRLIDTGAIDADHAYGIGGEFAAQHGPLMLQAEYDRIGIDRRQSTAPNPSFSGFYVEGSWLLTGEKRTYNLGNFAFDGPRVRHNFDPQHGGWGAVELALRYSEIDLNFMQGAPGTALLPGGVRGGDQRIVAAGVNWYLNPVVRVMFDWDNVHVQRLSPNAATFMTPAGAEIGQDFNAAAARVQLAF